MQEWFSIAVLEQLTQEKLQIILKLDSKVHLSFRSSGPSNYFIR